MIDDEQTEMKRVGRIWVTFALLGCIVGFVVFFGLHFGLHQSEIISSVAGISSGLIAGFGGAQLKWVRNLALKATDALFFIGWLTR
ncbi:MAG: hypothetical protein Hens3KO_02240 [Henriciella sp.]